MRPVARRARVPLHYEPVSRHAQTQTLYVDILRQQCAYAVERGLLTRVQSKHGAQWTTSGRKGGVTDPNSDDQGGKRSAAESKVERAVNIYKLPYLYGTVKTHKEP